MKRIAMRRAMIGSLVVALTAAALGSGVSGAGAASTSAPKVKVMVIGDLTSTIAFTVPEIVAAAKAGLKGVPNVEVSSCDSKGEAASGEACAKKAVDDGVAAVILGFGQGTNDILKGAGIPVLGFSDTTAANSFPNSSPYGLYAANGAALAKTGCKKLGILYLDGSDFLVDYVKAGAEANGAKEVARAPIAANAPDLTPAVAKLTAAGSQCIALSVVPAQVVQAVTAINQTGKKLQMAGVSAILTKEVRDSLGDLANGIIMVDTQLNAEDSSPAVKKVAKQIHAVDPDANITSAALVSYVAARILSAGIAKVPGEVTPTTLTDALNGLRDVDTGGITHPYSAIPLDNEAFSRFFNHYGISYKIVKGKPKAQTGFFDLTDILAAGANAASS